MSEKRFVRAGLVVIASAALAVAGCSSDQSASSGGDDKAGGSAEPVELTIANTASSLQYNPAVQYFVERVEELSGGSVRLRASHEWGDYAPDAEQQVVRAVADGEADLSWVGTRVFDTLGVTTFRALTAPMLIDSYPLQEAVISSEIPGEMLDSLEQIGVSGIAVLADGLRRPIAVKQPLLSPADFDGITFQAYRSETHAEALHALGAVQTEAFGPHRAAGLTAGEIDGFEMSLFGYTALDLSFLAPYVTANVSLWAQPVTLIANPAALEDLSDDQREALMEAGADAAEHSTDLVDGDADLVTPLCAAGARFADAPADAVDALRAAFAPVYATLEQDAPTKQFIEQIEELKATVDPGPSLSVPADCTGPADPTVTVTVETSAPNDASAAALNGTYRWTSTEEDARANGDARLVSADLLPWYPMIGTMTLDDGSWELLWRGANGAQATDGPGTYSIDGDRIVLSFPEEPLGTLAFTFATDDEGNVELEPVPPMQEDAQFVFSHYVWERIDDGAAEPDEAAIPDGIYRREVSEAELRDAGIDAATARREAGLHTFTLDGGSFLFVTQNDFNLPDCEGTYTGSGDQVTFVNTNECGPGPFFTATWRSDDGALRFENVESSAIIVATIAGQSWPKIG